MTIGDRTYRKRADAGLHLLYILRREAENQLGSRQRIMHAGELGGFPLILTVSRVLGQVEVAPALEGAPGTDLRLTSRSLTETDPVGLITRLENRLAQLETTKAKALAEIDHARMEIDHATASTGKPFPQAADLAAARERSRHIDEQLEAAAAPPPAEANSEVTAERPGTAVPAAGPQESDSEHGPDAPTLRPGRESKSQDRARPRWPSAAERATGPPPTRRHTPGQEAPGPALRSNPSPHYPDPRRSGGRSNVIPEHMGEEREAGE